MPRHRRGLSIWTLAGLALFVGCDPPSPQGSKPEAASSAPSRAADGAAVRPGLRIAVVPMGTTHDYWKSLHAGAVKAQRELGGVEIIFRGPEREDDRGQQIDLVQNFISSGVDAILLAPLDSKALLPAVKQASAAGKTVVIIDSALDGEVGKDFVSYVATDNEKGGRIAATRLIEVMGGKGKALLLRHHEGSASTDQRERGFVEEIAKAVGIQLIDPHRYAGGTRAMAQEAAENLLTAYGDIQGVFCPNESSTFGMLLALRSRSMTGKVKFVGFDASPGLVEALGKGEIDGLVVQSPLNIGYLGVKAAVDAMHHRKVEPRIDTGVTMVTRELLEKPEIKELVSPDLAKYLGG